MNNENYRLLEVSENATDEEIRASYERLKAKYNEEKWQDGEAGNNAARMLGRLDTAYAEIMEERKESARNTSGASSFEEVSAAIKSGDLARAQTLLDDFNERSAEWHYLQSIVFYKKNWMNESKKQLEIAMQLEPDNEKYKETYRKLCDRINGAAQQAQGQPSGGNGSVYEGQNMQSSYDDQMGGNFCSSCIQCCAINLCVNMLCNSCCR